MIVVSKKYKL